MTLLIVSFARLLGGRRKTYTERKMDSNSSASTAKAEAETRIRREDREDLYWWWWTLWFATFAMALVAILLAGWVWVHALEMTTSEYCNSRCFGPCRNGTNGVDGANGTSGVVDFAEFYALMPPNNNLAIGSGVDVNFNTAGPAKSGTDILQFLSFNFVINAAGIYEVAYFVAVNESTQFVLCFDGNPDPTLVTGRASTNNYVMARHLIQITTPGVIVSVRNAGPSSVTITPDAGGASPVSAHITFVRLM